MARTRAGVIKKIPNSKVRKGTKLAVIKNGKTTTGLWTGGKIGRGSFYDNSSGITIKGLRGAKAKLKVGRRTFVKTR